MMTTDSQLTFGKFKGQYVSQVPSYYLKYLIKKSFDKTVRDVATIQWDHRTQQGSHWGRPKLRRMS